MKIKMTDFHKHLNLVTMMSHAVLDGMDGLSDEDMETVAKMDSEGCLDISLNVNGIELNVEKFFEHMAEGYSECVHRSAKKILQDRLEETKDKLYTALEKVEAKVELVSDVLDEDFKLNPESYEFSPEVVIEIEEKSWEDKLHDGDTICKGSMAFGSGCGKCVPCRKWILENDTLWVPVDELRGYTPRQYSKALVEGLRNKFTQEELKEKLPVFEEEKDCLKWCTEYESL